MSCKGRNLSSDVNMFLQDKRESVLCTEKRASSVFDIIIWISWLWLWWWREREREILEEELPSSHVVFWLMFGDIDWRCFSCSKRELLGKRSSAWVRNSIIVSIEQRERERRILFPKKTEVLATEALISQQTTWFSFQFCHRHVCLLIITLSCLINLLLLPLLGFVSQDSMLFPCFVCFLCHDILRPDFECTLSVSLSVFPFWLKLNFFITVEHALVFVGIRVKHLWFVIRLCFLMIVKHGFLKTMNEKWGGCLFKVCVDECDSLTERRDDDEEHPRMSCSCWLDLPSSASRAGDKVNRRESSRSRDLSSFYSRKISVKRGVLSLH